MTASASVVDLVAGRDGLRTPAHIALTRMFTEARNGVRATERDSEMATVALACLRECATPQPAEQDAREAVARAYAERDGFTWTNERVLMAGLGGLRSRVAFERLADDHISINERTGLALTQAAPDGWRPIETAPKDGTHFLAYEATGDMFRAAFHREGYLMCFGGQPCVQTPEPDFWMPLPPAPPAQGAGG